MNSELFAHLVAFYQMRMPPYPVIVGNKFDVSGPILTSGTHWGVWGLGGEVCQRGRALFCHNGVQALAFALKLALTK